MHKGAPCIPRKEKKTHLSPNKPQPSADDIITFKRCYSTAKTDITYKRRVTVIQNLPASFGIPRTLWSQYALFEYIGSFPGPKPHGNSHTDDIYIRTTADTLEKINTHIKTQKPKDVYRDLLANDVTTDHNAPRDLKQVQNQKYLDRKKQSPQPSYSARNSADHMLSALSLVNDNPFVQLRF